MIALSLFLLIIVTASVNSATLNNKNAGLSAHSSNSSSSSMANVDYAAVPWEERALHVPPLQEIADVLSRGLRATFERVEASAAPCPDLSQPPYSLAAPGICGRPVLVELGGPPYLVPAVRRDKLYELRALLAAARRDRALLAGAGAGPWPYAGVNCEGIINMYVKDGEVSQGSHIVTVEPVGGAKGVASYRQQRLPPSETRTALLGNYLLSDGEPGQVIKVVAEKRIGPSNFITAIRETLKAHYGDKVVGLGGTFLLAEGRARHHVMPDFSATPLTSDAAVDGWLHYFEHRAPLSHVGTLVTGDCGLDLRVQHFHGSSAHGDGGHYHCDTTPAAARYEGYFVPAATVIRVDAPPNTHSFGRD